jgi:DNA modification methylase
MEKFEKRQYRLLPDSEDEAINNSKRKRAEFLDFKGMPAARGANAIHPYPAMFHPYLVCHFIENFTEKGDLVFDPFVGSGVSAVEAAKSERKFVGFDINPLALLIGQVRTTPLNHKILMAHQRDIINKIKNSNGEPVDFPNINFWFSPKRIVAISKIMKGYVDDNRKM